MPQAARVFVPQPVMGKSAGGAARLRRGPRPDDEAPGHAGGCRRPHGLLYEDKSRGDRSTPRLVEPATEEELHQLFLANDWTDKLPIVLPTEERVDGVPRAHLSRTGRGRGTHAADGASRPLGVHGGEGGGERGDVGREAGVLPGDPGSRGVEHQRPQQHVELGITDGRGQRPGARTRSR